LAPQRIVSLVPSLTEALFAFGAGERVAGRTRYCLCPPRAVGRVPVVGGTKKVDVRRVLDLEPDLIVAVREENSRDCVEELKRAGVPVFLGAPETVEDATTMLRELAGLVGAPHPEAVLGPIERARARLENAPRTPRRVFVPIWKNPYMSVGSDTYVHDLLATCGGENICGDAERYPVVTLEEVQAAQPEVVLLPDEPYPFSAEDLDVSCIPGTTTPSLGGAKR
jgi:ABC-type Fe3+-hydroxamate transport system substrate-binding protein